jgi:hypothetical protein
MKTELLKGEQILKAGAANLQKKIETVGGKLYLTNQRLIFEAHKFNFQRGVTEFQISSIQYLRPCWTMFLGIIPILPNSLLVRKRNGEEVRFVLFGR